VFGRLSALEGLKGEVKRLAGIEEVRKVPATALGINLKTALGISLNF
jgi:hypothetical protein